MFTEVKSFLLFNAIIFKLKLESLECKQQTEIWKWWMIKFVVVCVSEECLLEKSVTNFSEVLRNKP